MNDQAQRKRWIAWLIASARLTRNVLLLRTPAPLKGHPPNGGETLCTQQQERNYTPQVSPSRASQAGFSLLVPTANPLRSPGP